MDVDEYGRVELFLGHPPGPVIPVPPRPARSGKWAGFLKKFLADNPECLGCGRKAETGHHVVPFGADEALELDPTNIAPVCVPCHFVVCHDGNWHTYAPNVLADLADHKARLKKALPISGA